jgi:hypothetical protein
LWGALRFECGPGDAALSDDRLQGSDPDFWVVWDGNRHCAKVRPSLHYDVTAAVSDFLKPVLLQDATDVPPR